METRFVRAQLKGEADRFSGTTAPVMEPGGSISFSLFLPNYRAKSSVRLDACPDSRTCVRLGGRTVRGDGHLSRFADIPNEE